MVRADDRRDDRRERGMERRLAASGESSSPGVVTSVVPGEGRQLPEASLLQQQCWLWGRDARRAEGNLLVEYGFDRVAPPRPGWGNTCYTFDLHTSATVRLWSFGLFYSDGSTGGVFIERTAFEPRLLPLREGSAPVWKSEHFTRARVPRLPGDSRRLLALLPPLLAWIGAYEQWVLDAVGLKYRYGCLDSCPTRVCDPDELPRRWWDVATRWRQTLAH